MLRRLTREDPWLNLVNLRPVQLVILGPKDNYQRLSQLVQRHNYLRQPSQALGLDKMVVVVVDAIHTEQ